MAPFPDPLTTLQEHAAFVRAVARRLVADPSDVDDLVQETWLRALANGRAPESVRAWLAKVVRSAWTDRHRAERARRQREQLVAAEQARAATATPRADDAYGFASLTRALEALPADYRRVLQLRYHADLTPTAIARELAVPLPTVKARLQRALQLLRSDLDARHGGGHWRLVFVPLLAPIPATTAGGWAITTGVLVSKLLLTVVALVALLVLLPSLFELWSPPPAAPLPPGARTPEPHAASAAVVTGSEDDEANAGPNESLQRERGALTPTPSPADEIVRGRILYQSTGQGVPFLPVYLRDGNRTVELRTDRAGAFAAAGRWPADVEIAVAGAPTPRGTTPARQGSAATNSPISSSVPMLTAPMLAAAESLGTATPADTQAARPPFQPLATAAVRDDDGWRLLVDLGPTYMLKVADDARLQGLRLRAFLRDGDDALATRIQRADAQIAAGERVPSEDLWWCRVAMPPPHYGDRCRLVVVAEGGFWRAELTDVGTKGVVGPLDVTLQEQGHVRGTVRDAFGATLAEVLVVVTIGDGARALRFASKTDAQGAYLLTGVQPGDGSAKVGGEEFEPNATAVRVLAGMVADCDLVVRPRAKGGTIAGTITTQSGREFPHVSVHLTSRLDGSIWRTADIRWHEVDGRQQATFAFDDVPLVECEVQLNPFAPCRVGARRQTATPPQQHVRFHVEDAVPERTLAIDVRRPDGSACAGWTVQLRGDDGWRMDLRSSDVTGPVRVPQLPGTWSLLGQNVRRRTGRLEAIGGDRLAITSEPGWSVQLVAMDIANFFPVRAAQVFADGQLVGVLDDEGELQLDLPTAPKTLAVEPTHWRIYRDSAHRSDVDENGAIGPEARGHHLGVYLQRVP